VLEPEPTQAEIESGKTSDVWIEAAPETKEKQERQKKMQRATHEKPSFKVDPTGTWKESHERCGMKREVFTRGEKNRTAGSRETSHLKQFDCPPVKKEPDQDLQRKNAWHSKKREGKGEKMCSLDTQRCHVRL